MTATVHAFRPVLLETPAAQSRAQRFKANMAARGFVQCNVWIPAAAVADMQLQGERLRECEHLTVGPLRDTVSGKLVKLA